MSKTNILICGPESVGKTTLTHQLSVQFNLPFIEEFARKYFDMHPLSNDQEVIKKIAREQIQLETKSIQENAVVLLDTGLINIKIWIEFLGYETPPFIKEYLLKKPYNFALLLYPNIPWVADGQRANPNDRIALFKRFRAELEKYGIPYQIIDAEGPQRLQESIQSLEKFLAKV